ncbi:rodlin [Streptomyces sp. ODS28]|uniref:rodlin n=1 Tax=Streptomyces sp. ODS28 TaxID=3136688 RepID=UPI0031E59616
MIKNALAAAAVATAIVGLGAPQAMADDDLGTTDSANGKTVNGNGAQQNYGNQATHGTMAPQSSLVQGSLDKLCLDLLHDTEIQNIVALVNVGLQDVPILSQKQQQVCAENSTQAEGDGQLSNLVEDLPVISENGAGNS